MRIREIALALPLVMGFAACKTSSAQGSRTASTGQEGTGATASTTGTSSGSASSQQGSSMGGASTSGDVTAHSDDQVVSGKIAAVSAESLTITTDSGDQRTLQLVPQTSLQVNGQEGKSSDLAEGQPVRASYNTVGDRDVAVEVRAGTGVGDPSGQSEPGLTPGSNEQH